MPKLLRAEVKMSKTYEIFEDLNPPERLLMGPGPVDVYPSVLRAIASPMLGQFDPKFTEYMDQVMVLFRQVFQTDNNWTFLINGTARAAIEACLVSMVEPGDKVLVPRFGRFGFLLTEIAQRCGADVITLDAEWGSVFQPEQIIESIKKHSPKIVTIVHGDTSTTMAQPLQEIGQFCRENGAILYVDACATLGGNDLQVDKWQIDAVTAGLQKCMSGPPGSAPTTLNDRVAKIVNARKHIEVGIKPEGYKNPSGRRISSNYFDLAMLMDYWSPERLNHHTEATNMLYAARECARVLLSEGLENVFERHKLANNALRVGLEAMDLKLFGDEAYRMTNVTGVVIPNGVDGEAIRHCMLNKFNIEIGTSFGALHGKIWRIGAMGHVCRKINVLKCLDALSQSLKKNGYSTPMNAGVQAAEGYYALAEKKVA